MNAKCSFVLCSWQCCNYKTEIFPVRKGKLLLALVHWQGYKDLHISEYRKVNEKVLVSK